MIKVRFFAAPRSGSGTITQIPDREAACAGDFLMSGDVISLFSR